MEIFCHYLALFNESFTMLIIFPAVFLFGLYLSFRLKFIQVYKIKESLLSLLKKSDGEGDISHYQAISAVLAGNLGTGNISGIAIALATGGPGAIVWMWIMALMGGIIQYASCVLGMQYREKNKEGEFVGGPMYYLTRGCNSPIIGALFASFAILAAFTVGNFAQINSVTLPLQTFAIHPLFWSIGIALLVGVVILGGMQRFANVASSIVPAKAVLYLGTCLIILYYNFDKLMPALKLMINSAFDFSSMAGGILGFGIVQTITTGFSRAIFATDAGTGIAPMIQSSAKTIHPVKDGIVAVSAPFLVMILCSLTSLVLVVTDAWQTPGLESTNMCIFAFTKGINSPIGGYIVLISLILFAYTTIISWGICLDRAVEFLFGKRLIIWFKLLYIGLIPLGALIDVKLIWLLADLSIGLMMAMNLVGVMKLTPEIIRLTKNYFIDEKKELAALELDQSNAS